MSRRLFSAAAGLAVSLVWSFAAHAQEEFSYVSFPAPNAQLTLASFKTTFAAATDAEDEYPIVLALLRQGRPVWSHVATIDPGWPFLSLEFKVAWAPDSKSCLCCYRRNRADLTVLGLEIDEPRVQPRPISIEDAVDAALTSAHDNNEQVALIERAEQLELPGDGSAKLTLTVSRAKKHKLVLTIDRAAARVTKWALE